MMSETPIPKLLDQKPEIDQFRTEALQGLLNRPKFLPCKYLYDARGAELFEQICTLEEYYPTRTETAILQENRDEIVALFEPGTVLIEYGSGSSTKTRLLLDEAKDLEAYVPVDISIEQLRATSAELARAYPGLRILPVCADYTGPFDLPTRRDRVKRRVAYFPGSTIGNFDPDNAERFLARIARLVEQGGGLLIGVDLEKDRRILEAAYNDRSGVTAHFNLNLLRRMNSELGTDFALDQFQHRAIYNEAEGRVEMHLVSRVPQSMTLGEHSISFEEGETIHTENSYKFTLDRFARLAGKAGFKVDHVWIDDDAYFSIQYLTVD